MPFPEIERVVYRKNPLDRVICQLRYPPILKIDSEAPVHFQEHVRGHFPNLLEKTELVPPKIPLDAPPQLSEFMIHPKSVKNYEFATEDNVWTINLTSTFLALSTTSYEKWEDFRKSFELPIEALKEHYTPSFYNRIGLRYIDLIRRSKLELDDSEWSKLLKPHILGTLGDPDVKDNIINYECNNILKLSEDDCLVRINTKLLKDKENKEELFLIDSDFIKTTNTPIDKLPDILEALHTRASRLIQWCITPTLHEAMKPEKVK